MPICNGLHHDERVQRDLLVENEHMVTSTGYGKPTVVYWCLYCRYEAQLHYGKQGLVALLAALGV